MADKQTPPRRLYSDSLKKRSLPYSPSVSTPSNIPRKKKSTSLQTEETEMQEEKDISLRDILNTPRENKHDILEERMSSFEKRLTEKFSSLMPDMKKQIKEEIEVEKKKMEDDINSNFQFLEGDLRSKLTENVDKAHNDLEQYSRKNSVMGYLDSKKTGKKPLLNTWRYETKLSIGVLEIRQI
ncbi:hypothetical protein OS493_003166, partial [Desmophyllum pertusum]